MYEVENGNVHTESRGKYCTLMVATGRTSPALHVDKHQISSIAPIDSFCCAYLHTYLCLHFDIEVTHQM